MVVYFFEDLRAVGLDFAVLWGRSRSRSTVLVYRTLGVEVRACVWLWWGHEDGSLC